MLKINSFKKWRALGITTFLLLGGMFGFSYLTFIPTQSFAVEVSTPIYGDSDTRKMADITYMQEMSGGICERSAVNDAKQLIDRRDNKLYWVTKLADNKCWMTQNLDYDIKAGDFSGAVATKTGNINTGWSSTQTAVQSWDPGDYYYKHVSATDWISCGSPVSNMSTCPSKGNWSTTAPAAEGQHYHVGNYYSWNAATAGTGGSITSGEASSSICPKGWKLPTSNGTSADFAKLMGAYGLRTDNGSESNVDKVRLTPLYFIPAGGVHTGGLGVAGSYGGYWSSTPNSDSSLAYTLYFISGALNPSYYNARYLGRSVRCVADMSVESSRTLSDITYMQEMSGGVCERSVENETKQLKDSRDGNLYWVTKLKDGNCWMTQNLDFDIPSTLKASDTDVTSDTTISVIKYNNSNGVGSWGNDNAQTKQYDPGVMYKTNPTGTDNCSGSGITSLTNSACATAGWSTSGSDKHYTIGNYYSWNAATAGTGNSAGSTQGTKAAGSICPKGWHLPTAGTGSYNTKGSFAYLLRQYGFASSDTSGNVGTTPNSMVDAPMYWLRGGGVDSTYLGSAGNYGYYWPSNVYSDTYAYRLSFNTGTYLNPSYYSPRYLGFPVRCVSDPDAPEVPETLVDSPNVAITVNSTITIDATSGMDEEADFSKVTTGTISATISANQAYSVLLSTQKTALTDSAVDDQQIDMITTDKALAAGVSEWGIKKKLSAAGTNPVLGSTDDADVYSPVGTGDEKVLFYQSANPEQAKTIDFSVGVGVSVTLAPGSYATDVTVTAAIV